MVIAVAGTPTSFNRYDDDDDDDDDDIPSIELWQLHVLTFDDPLIRFQRQ